MDWPNARIYRRGAIVDMKRIPQKRRFLLNMVGWGGSPNHPILTIAPDLGEEAAPYRPAPPRAGFAPAHIFHLANQELRRFMPCRAVPSAGRNFLGVPLESDEEDEEQPRETGFSKPSPNYYRSRERGAGSDRLVAGHHHRELRMGQRQASTPLRLECRVGRLWLCGHPLELRLLDRRPLMDFGVEDLDEAAIGLQYAIPWRPADWSLSLLNRSSSHGSSDYLLRKPRIAITQRRVSSSRGRIVRLWISMDDLVEQFVGRLSREGPFGKPRRSWLSTVYYTAAIDGIPGPNFLRRPAANGAISARKTGECTSDKCLWTPQTSRGCEWAQPYIADVLRTVLIARNSRQGHHLGGGAMKKLIGIILTAACCTFNLSSGTALADRPCTVEGMTPAEFSTALHAGDESLRTDGACRKLSRRCSTRAAMTRPASRP